MSIDVVELRAHIGARTRTVLNAIGGTQRAIAADLGVSQSFLSQVASGQTFPSMAMLYELSMRHEVSLSWLVTGAGSMWSNDRRTPDPRIEQLTMLLADLVQEQPDLREQIRAAVALEPERKRG